LQELCRKPHGGKCRRLALLSRVEPRCTDAMICTIERELLDALDRVNPAARITRSCKYVPPAPMILREAEVERSAMDLRGTVALVTGGNGGLGQRICRALAKEGAHIAVVYAQSREQAEGVARDQMKPLLSCRVWSAGTRELSNIVSGRPITSSATACRLFCATVGSTHGESARSQIRLAIRKAIVMALGSELRQASTVSRS